MPVANVNSPVYGRLLRLLCGVHLVSYEMLLSCIDLDMTG